MTLIFKMEIHSIPIKIFQFQMVSDRRTILNLRKLLNSDRTRTCVFQASRICEISGTGGPTDMILWYLVIDSQKIDRSKNRPHFYTFSDSHLRVKKSIEIEVFNLSKITTVNNMID